jgi:hypothetical protein
MIAQPESDLGGGEQSVPHGQMCDRALEACFLLSPTLEPDPCWGCPRLRYQPLVDAVMGRAPSGANGVPVLRKMMKRGHDVESAPSI